MKITFIGLGKLGMPVAETLAVHHEVKGFDIHSVDSHSVMLCDNLESAMKDSEVIFIAVQTPHDPKYGGATPSSHLPPVDFDYSYVEDVLRNVSKLATPTQIVVLISTVLPGTIRQRFIPLLGAQPFIYNPYLIAMGTVEHDMVNPEMLIFGTASGMADEHVKRLLDLYRPVMSNSPREVIGTYEEAESLKVFYNTFISAKLAIVNMIQDVAIRVGHMNVDVVTSALADSSMRITSGAYMVAGMGDGGPCHPRDCIALSYIASKLYLGYDVFKSISTIREKQAENMAIFLVGLGSPYIVILGTSYKRGVPYTDGSYSLLVGHYAAMKGACVTYNSVLPDVNGVVYLLSHKDTHSLYEFPAGSTIVDPWRSCPRMEGRNVIHYGNSR